MKQNITIRMLMVIIVAFHAAAGMAQKSINHYKYVVIPERFGFSKEDNQYSLNTTTKLWLDQKGFVAFVGAGNLPASVAANRCNALTAEVVQNNGLLTTKLTLLLKDCHGNVLFKSKEGKSREKVFAVAYNEALSDAFSSLSSLDYQYDSTAVAQQQSEVAPASQPAPVASSPQSVPATASAPLPSQSPSASSFGDITGVLYAQSIENGFQLVDTSPKKVMELLKTSAADYFIARSGNVNGVVFKKDGEWLLEYYKDNKLVTQKLSIRF